MTKTNSHREFTRFSMGMLSVTSLIIIVIIFYTAYFNETKSVIITVNRHGEADLEAIIILPAIAMATMISSAYIFNDFRESCND